MIVFSPLRTKRLNIELQELSIANAIRLCKMPRELQEAGKREFVSMVVSSGDTSNLTVQERELIVVHYLAQSNGGDADFPIGDGKLSDYLVDFGASKESISIGEFGGDKWNMRPLLARHAESIERLISVGEIECSRAGWWFGAMSAMMFRDGEELALMNDAELDEYILERSKAFQSYPETEYLNLLYAFIDGVSQLDHIFKLDFQDDGIAFRAKEEEAGLPPARFPFYTAVTHQTRSIFGKHRESGD